MLTALVILVVAIDIWGAATQGTLVPDADQFRDENANRVVMVFGATGSAGDGLLKAAIDSPDVDKVYVITRRSSPRIDAGVTSGKVAMLLQKDFTDYSNLINELSEVNTVLWGLGTSSLSVDDATYTRIHVDFPIAFIKQWLSVRDKGPMAFHYITGMGTDGKAYWAREKRRTEHEMAALADSNDLRTFSYRSGFIRPASEEANVFHYLGQAIFRPGSLVVTSKELGNAMLEISARTTELKNGTLIDNADTIAYAKAYQNYHQQ